MKPETEKKMGFLCAAQDNLILKRGNVRRFTLIELLVKNACFSSDFAKAIKV